MSSPAAAAPLPQPSDLPSRKARQQWIAIGVLAGLMGALLFALGVNPWDLVTQFHFLTNLAQEMFPPNVALLWTSPRIWTNIWETLAMAFLGTLGGVVLAFGGALLAADNTSPHPMLRLALRSLMAVERAITSFFVLLVLLIALGLGPFAGTVTLTITTFGMFGKLFADAIEQAERGPCEAVGAVGATRTQVIAFAVLPQVMPALVAQSLYAFDFNLRTAIALGIFGAGGLGFELNGANNMLRYRDVLGYTLLTMLFVTAAERVSDALRRRILNTR